MRLLHHAWKLLLLVLILVDLVVATLSYMGFDSFEDSSVLLTAVAE